MNRTEQLHSIALSCLSCGGPGVVRELYRSFGSATAVFEHRRNLRDVMPDTSEKLEKTLSASAEEALHKAETELEWSIDNGIDVITMDSPAYPQRLAECPDAPIVLYYKGNGDLNHKKIISIVGTRHCTAYGRDLLSRMMRDLAAYANVLVVSGLAYGIDITAHREALKNDLPTVAVLAHGLDTVYPGAHRSVAAEMIKQGGLLTEYRSHTRLTKGNFIQRNRIVAGLADCTILVESAIKGGGLITMGIARDYNRDTFAFPGAVNAEYSRGCNNLIRDNAAALISDAEDLVTAMGWNDERNLSKARQEGIARDLFADLSDDEKTVVRILQENNDLQVNILTVKSGIPVNKVYSLIFSLEMKGIVRSLAGGTCHLL